jgi:glucose/arabinose dehydrogenase
MRTPALLSLALLAAGPVAAQPAISLVPVAQGLGRIAAVTHAGDGSGRLFLTRQTGQVLILEGGAVLPTPFLDISGLVSCCGERGLLSVAFHPDYAENGFFYVDYTDVAGNTVVARYSVSAGDPNRADPASARVILTQVQPFENHNGGQLQFGPDGRLYIGLGDGGSADDPQGNGQNRATLLGKLLRIDVDTGNPYAIPPDNPFVGQLGTRPEIWALGLRNPWRFSFDRVTGDMWVADVGQSSREEVDFEPAGSTGGRNYGWAQMEGSICRLPPGGCASFTAPLLEYDHSLGCSITGGYRYRGIRFPSLAGVYLFGDFCSGRIWGARESGGGWTVSQLLDTNLPISTFGEDEDGTLYVAGTDGRLLRIEAQPFVKGDVDGDGRVDAFWQNSASGVTGAWLMNGVTTRSTHLFTSALSDTRWRLVGTHDLNGDGKTDLLWQHLSQGWIAFTPLDRLVAGASAVLEPPREPDLAWRIVATGDLDLDGRADLLWRNLVDGRLRVWLMDGLVRRNEVALLDGAPLDPTWRLAAVEDLTRDGRLDIVFHHQADGRLVVAVTNGPRLVDALALTPPTVGPEWQIAASGDFRGDGGTGDLVWRQGPTGALVATFLEGTQMVDAASFVPAAVDDPTWLLLGPR